MVWFGSVLFGSKGFCVVFGVFFFLVLVPLSHGGLQFLRFTTWWQQRLKSSRHPDFIFLTFYSFNS